MGSDAHGRVKAKDVVSSFHGAAELHGLPESLLSDNGAVFVGDYRRGKVLLEYELERLGIRFKNSRPYHPQTLGKVERLHQTLKRYLAKQPPASTPSELQGQLDAFAHYYNHMRPHRALGGSTPLQAYGFGTRSAGSSRIEPPHRVLLSEVHRVATEREAERVGQAAQDSTPRVRNAVAVRVYQPDDRAITREGDEDRATRAERERASAA